MSSLAVADVLDVETLDGSNGFVLKGGPNGGRFGSAVSIIGDLNGDGFDEVAIGAREVHAFDQPNVGAAVVLYGGADFDAEMEITEIDGSNGFAVVGLAAADQLGASLANAGDVNGDGREDLLVGAEGAQVGAIDAGGAYVIFGSDEEMPRLIRGTDLDGTNGFGLSGDSAVSETGRGVSGVGDFNGDGLDDLLIGAPSEDPQDLLGAGAAYVVYGRSDWPKVLELAELAEGDGVRIEAFEVRGGFGTEVQGVGDVNGDRFADVLVAAPRRDGENPSSDFAYLVMGGPNVPSVVSLADYDGIDVVQLFNEDGDFRGFGKGLGYADVNGDGWTDFALGTDDGVFTNGDPSGVVDVVYGRPLYDVRLDLDDLDGLNGFKLGGIVGDEVGQGVAFAGDFNGDGTDDLVVGAPGVGFGGTAGGDVSIVYGRRSFPASLEVSAFDGSVAAGRSVHHLSVFDDFGEDVGGGGDVNGDGFDDVVIGAPATADDQGAAYVVFGRPTAEPQLTLSGSCPGTISIVAEAMSPSDPVDLYVGSAGFARIESEPCAPVLLDVAAWQGVASATADPAGTAIWTLELAADDCGMEAQAVDRTTCVLTPPRAISGGAR